MDIKTGKIYLLRLWNPKQHKTPSEDFCTKTNIADKLRGFLVFDILGKLLTFTKTNIADKLRGFLVFDILWKLLTFMTYQQVSYRSSDFQKPKCSDRSEFQKFQTQDPTLLKLYLLRLTIHLLLVNTGNVHTLLTFSPPRHTHRK